MTLPPTCRCRSPRALPGRWRRRCRPAAVSISTKHRATPAHFLAEVIATLGLIVVIFALARSGAAGRRPQQWRLYRGGVLFTSSTSSPTRPSRSAGCSPTRSPGIAPSSTPAFIAAQVIGGALAVGGDPGAVSAPDPGAGRRHQCPITRARPHRPGPCPSQRRRHPASRAGPPPAPIALTADGSHSHAPSHDRRQRRRDALPPCGPRELDPGAEVTVRSSPTPTRTSPSAASPTTSPGKLPTGATSLTAPWLTWKPPE